MYNLNQRLHFIGIGGVGMAGIAEVLLNLGYSVSGSDLRKNSLVERLETLGADVSVGHSAQNLSKDTDVVIISSAVPKDNPELQEAELRNIPIIPRAEMLAELMRMNNGIAVAGSHGKTTTTSMVSKVLIDAGHDPTVIIGGRVLTQQSGAKVGSGQYLVAEADESDGSFRLLRPAIAVVTNIDLEHLSHYGSLGALEEAFLKFISSVPFYGVVVGCFDDPLVAGICKQIKRRVSSYGFSPEFDFSAKDVSIENGTSSFTLVVSGQEHARVALPMPGEHYVKNALAAIAVGAELGVYPEEALRSLESFPGVARRSELVYRSEDVVVIDDYGHHPTEIAATLAGVRRSWIDGRGGKLRVLFQPHRYTRTKELFSDFVNCFSDADEVVINEIYAASEEPLAGITGKRLADSIQHSEVCFVAEPLDAVAGLVQTAVSGDVFVTLGAGSVSAAAPKIAQELQERGL